jgi:hypothetical protein
VVGDSRFLSMAENVAAGVMRLVFVDIASLVCIAIPLAWLWYTSVSAEAKTK